MKAMTVLDRAVPPGGTDDAEQASAPAAISRRDAVSPGARGLIFTILGEFVLPSGGSAWTSAIIEVMGRVGVEEKATRQALMRIAADGWLSAERIGRRTRWRLTPSAEGLLTEGAGRIYGFGGRREGWDGTWLLVLARTPEADRPARHVLRSRLTWAGFGSPMPGVWVSTHSGRLGDVQQALATTGSAGEVQIFCGAHAGGQLRLLAEQAWDLEATARRYHAFSATFAAPAPADPLARLVRLVHAWRRFPWTDPDLPAELLPPGWPRPRAAATFRRRHAQWASAALQEWRQASEA